MRVCARASSARPEITSRSAQVANSAESCARAGRYDQISSAVKDRIGAKARTRISSVQYIAVCAERRAGLPARRV